MCIKTCVSVTQKKRMPNYPICMFAKCFKSITHQTTEISSTEVEKVLDTLCTKQDFSSANNSPSQTWKNCIVAQQFSHQKHQYRVWKKFSCQFEFSRQNCYQIFDATFSFILKHCECDRCKYHLCWIEFKRVHVICFQRHGFVKIRKVNYTYPLSRYHTFFSWTAETFISLFSFLYR